MSGIGVGTYACPNRDAGEKNINASRAKPMERSIEQRGFAGQGIIVLGNS
jgi:hypothetical protein